MCIYETADGLTRVADLRQRNHVLSSRVAELESVLYGLRYDCDVEASNTLARIRIGDGYQNILNTQREESFSSSLSSRSDQSRRATLVDQSSNDRP